MKVPVFVYCGIHDAQCPYEFSEEINAQLFNSKLFTFHYSNHSPFIEEKERFNQMVVQFKAMKSGELLSSTNI